MEECSSFGATAAPSATLPEPGTVAVTSSQALCNATLPYARDLARLGAEAFGKVDAGHASAINMKAGKLTCAGVAEAFPDLPKA